MKDLSEVWCRRCNRAAAEVIHGESYCHDHALMERWKMVAPAWRSRRVK
jgi:hypothetical protein